MKVMLVNPSYTSHIYSGWRKAVSIYLLLGLAYIAAAPWVSSDRRYFHFNPNNLLYWEAMKYGCEKQFKYFDFGRSKWNSGAFKFKKPWGAMPKQLYYLYYLNAFDDMPNLDPLIQSIARSHKYGRSYLSQ